jgi:hypothetical protein
MRGRVNNILEGRMVFQRCFAFALTAALGLRVVAQELPTAPVATGEKAAGTAPLYQSAFTDYKSFREPEVMSWRASNDQVRDAGGTGEHDMSKMSGAAAVPGHDMPPMKPDAAGHVAVPGHQMGSTKSHDMGKAGAAPGPAPKKMSVPGKARSEKKAVRATPASSAPTDAKKPAEAPPQAMDHSKMNHKD